MSVGFFLEDIYVHGGAQYAADLWRRKDSIEIMQWTGLNDKNGKEIYEGDILLAPAVKWRTPTGDYKCVVAYENDGFYAKHDNGVGETLSNLIIVRGGHMIGNIYENPELLK